MGEEILPLQRACYREHNSLVFLPRCTLSLLSVCTAYLLLQSLTILVGPEINWNKSKMKYELKCRGGEGGGNSSGRVDSSSDRSAVKDSGSPGGNHTGPTVCEWWGETVGRQGLISPTAFHHCFCCLINTLCPRLLIPSQIKDLTPSLCMR